jgi:hypothetical protein
LKDTCLLNLRINKDEIIIGGINHNEYYKELRCTDLLFAFHPSNIPLFQINPYLELSSFKKGGEESFTKFVFDNFKKVSLRWIYEEDFNIRR